MHRDNASSDQNVGLQSVGKVAMKFWPKQTLCACREILTLLAIATLAGLKLVPLKRSITNIAM
jgi:hypothetical protein